MAEVKPVVIDAEYLTRSIAEYKQQFDIMNNQIQQLDKNYQDQRTLTVNTINQIAGAISALETLLQAMQTPPAPTE